MLLWSPPDDHTHIFAYLVVVAVLVRTLVSCCEVPSQSLVAELTSDYDERTALVRFRFLFAWGGGLLVFFLANTVFLRPDATHEFGQLNPAGYWLYGLCGAILMAATVLISAIGQHRRVAHLPATRPEPGSPKRHFAEIWESLRHPAALILLAMQAANSTDPKVYKEKVMEIANGPGEKIYPGELAKGLELLAAGKPIDYEGATAVTLVGPGESAGRYREIVVQDGKNVTVGFR